MIDTAVPTPEESNYQSLKKKKKTKKEWLHRTVIHNRWNIFNQTCWFWVSYVKKAIPTCRFSSRSANWLTCIDWKAFWNQSLCFKLISSSIHSNKYEMSVFWQALKLSLGQMCVWVCALLYASACICRGGGAGSGRGTEDD